MGLTADDKKMLRKYINVEEQKALAALNRVEGKEVELVGEPGPIDIAGSSARVREIVAHFTAIQQTLTSLSLDGLMVDEPGEYRYRAQGLAVPKTVELHLLEKEKQARQLVVRRKFAAKRRDLEELVRAAQLDILAADLPEIKTQLEALRAKLTELVGESLDDAVTDE